jgi:hypothetical protein
MPYKPGGCKVIPSPTRSGGSVRSTPRTADEITSRQSGSIKPAGGSTLGDWSSVTTGGDTRGADPQSVKRSEAPVPEREAESWESTSGYGG